MPLTFFLTGSHLLVVFTVTNRAQGFPAWMNSSVQAARGVLWINRGLSCQRESLSFGCLKQGVDVVFFILERESEAKTSPAAHKKSVPELVRIKSSCLSSIPLLHKAAAALASCGVYKVITRGNLFC